MPIGFIMSDCTRQPCAIQVRRFGLRTDESGTVAILFGATVALAFMLAGGAIDFGHASIARSRMQSAVDAAALAAGRTWQLENSQLAVEKTARAVYENSGPTGIGNSTFTLTTDIIKKTLRIETSGSVKLPFLSIAGLGFYIITANAEVALPEGSNTETHLEIAMMLDVTGSMAGTKLDALKAAAKDLVDIVVWDDQSRYTSRVALVPFADAVNIGNSTLIELVRGDQKAGSCLTSSSPCTSFASNNASSLQWTWGSPAKWFQFWRPDGGRNVWQLSSYCVTERTGANWATDMAPGIAANRVGPSYGSPLASSCGYMTIDPYDLEVNSILPLTSDKGTLKRRIDKLAVGGSTAGQMGTAWAWYMLSPNWAYLWPSNSRPQAYNAEKVKKIAVLMTDGEYNTGHCNGVVANDSGDGSGGNTTKINCRATNGLSDYQARQICSAMKTGTGITVYTVGFDLGGNPTAIDTLKMCASDPSKFYNAADGGALRYAFRDIAIQLSQLRLTN